MVPVSAGGLTAEYPHDAATFVRLFSTDGGARIRVFRGQRARGETKGCERGRGGMCRRVHGPFFNLSATGTAQEWRRGRGVYSPRLGRAALRGEALP